MLKKILFLFIVLGLNLNGKDIVSVKLGKERLETLYSRNLHIICELKNYSIILTDDYNNLKGLEYKFIEARKDEKYYLIRVLDEKIDLSRYGRILLKDGDLYLIATDEEGFHSLKKERIFLRYITFEPMVKREIRFIRKFDYNPLIQGIVNKVNPDSVLSFVRRLQNFHSRFSTYDSTFYAALWIGEKFYEYGCDTVIYQYHTAGHAPNVIGIKYGTFYPANHYTIISGHFDAYSNQIPTFVPGADDNASGTAGVIECARVLKDYRFEYTINFIAFSGEEFGLYGSEYYANMASNSGDSILGVVNGDMIGYVDHQPESVDVVTNNASIPFADYFINCVNNYTSLKTLKYVSDWAQWSDHAPFWNYGYNSFCLIEDENVPNPFYHTIGDTIGGGYNDNLFATEVIKAEVATIASLSILSRSPSSPNPPILLAPFDCAKIPDTRPTLKFISFDPENDNIAYKVLIDDSPYFSSPETIETPVYFSGDTVSIQISNPLNYGTTYYWKVQCKDPEGSNLWSDYSSKYSLTISNDIPELTCSFFIACSTQFSGNHFNGTKISGNTIILDQYSYTYDTLFYEDFESGIPSDWEINDGNGDNIKWSAGTKNYLLYFVPPSYSSKYAYYSDRDAGYNVLNTAEELTSPSIYIPQGATSLNIAYGYGIRIYQSGEKMQFKYKRHTTSWLGWIIKYTHYTNSSGDINFEIDLNTTPMDSLKLRWTYTDQLSTNHYGYACAFDNLIVYFKIPIQNNTGEMVTDEIDFEDFVKVYPRDIWGDIIITKSSSSDSIGVKVEYYNGSGWELIPDLFLPDNSNGIFGNNTIDTISLEYVSPSEYNKIRIKTIFKRYSSKSSTEPQLISLEVGNLSRYEGINEYRNNELSLSKNIFTDMVKIEWHLKKDTKVSVNLYDITGRKVIELYNGFSQKDKFIIFKPDKNLNSGIYFISLNADNINIIKKIIYVR